MARKSAAELTPAERQARKQAAGDLIAARQDAKAAGRAGDEKAEDEAIARTVAALIALRQ